MVPQHVRFLWYISYFGLLAIVVVVMLVSANVFCSKPTSTKARCCSRDPNWALATIPTQCGSNNEAILFALGIMALFAALLQAIVFLFMGVSIVTVYLLIAYNFVNWGWLLSIWTGRFFKACQACCVGVGVVIMWAATGYETAMLAMGTPAPDTAVSLSMLYALSLCSLVDFILYVVYPYCWCCGVRINEPSLRNTFLDNKTNEPVPMYTIGDDETEEDITNNP